MASKYERLKVLGEGSFGTAYLAVNKDTGEKQVCKDIALNLLRDEDSVRCVLNEVRILSRCRHSRNVVSYLDAFVSGAFLTIVMEYADKGDMQQRINRQRGLYFQEKLILGWFVQIVFALEYIHSRNILHRDIKPSNIFMSSCGLLKLGDFGIARMLEAEGDMAETVLGTPLYLSPEICNCQPYDSQTDMWSLGVVLYQLCSLTVPFIASTRQELFNVIATRPHKPIPGHYGPLLADLVDVLLSKDPSRRPSASQLLRVPSLQGPVRALAHLRRPRSPSPKAPGRKGRTPSSSSLSPSPTSSQRSSPSPPSVSPEQPPPASPELVMAPSPVQLKRLRNAQAVSPLVSRVGSPKGRLLLPNLASPKSSGSGLPRAASPLVAKPSRRRSSCSKSPSVGLSSPKPPSRPASPSHPALFPSCPSSPKSSCSKSPIGRDLSSRSTSPQRSSSPVSSPTPMEEEEVAPRYINAALPPVEISWVACANEDLCQASPGKERSPKPGNSERVCSPTRNCVQDSKEECDSRLPSFPQRRSPRVRAVRKLPSPSAGKNPRQKSCNKENEVKRSPLHSRLDHVQKTQNGLANSPPQVPDCQSPGGVKRRLSRKRSRSRAESPLARPSDDSSNNEAQAAGDNAGATSTTSRSPEARNPVAPTENCPNVYDHCAERRHSAPPNVGMLVSERDRRILDVCGSAVSSDGMVTGSRADDLHQEERIRDQKASEYGGRTFSVPAKLRRLAKVSPFLEVTIERQRRALAEAGQDSGQDRKGRPPTLCLAKVLAHTKESSHSSTRDSGTHSLDFSPSPVLEPGKPLGKMEAVKTPDEMETEEQCENAIHQSDGPDDMLNEDENTSASQEEMPSEDHAMVNVKAEVILLPNTEESERKELGSLSAVSKERASVSTAMEVSVRADRSHDSGYGSAGSLSHETKLEVGNTLGQVHTTSVTVQTAGAKLHIDAEEAGPASKKNAPPENEEELKQRYRKRIAGKQLIFDFDSKVVQLYQNESSDVSPRKWFVGPDPRLAPPPPKRKTSPDQKREADNDVTPTNSQPQSQYGTGQRTSSCVVEVGDVWDGSSTEEASGSERCTAPSCDATASGEGSSAQAPSTSRVAAAAGGETSGMQQQVQNGGLPRSLPAHMRGERSSASDVRSPLEDDVFLSEGSPNAWVKEVSCNATYTVKFHREEESRRPTAVALEPSTLAVVCYNVFRSSQQDVGRAVRELREYLAKKLGTEACLLVYHLIRHTAAQPALGSSLALRNTIQSYAPFFPLFTQLLHLESLAAVRGRPPM